MEEWAKRATLAGVAHSVHYSVSVSVALDLMCNSVSHVLRMLRETGAGFRIRYAQVMNQCSGISTFNKK